ncbi:MAG: 2-hydroxyacyl-CoA dehydratase [Proteobacteria bacterium]|nr:2-hydroxyacyl-CoA dehydratase [Pseudomonadota bacterium]
MENLQFFDETASKLDNPEIEAWKKSGGRVVGTTCTNIPEELIHAAGLLPVRLRAPGLQDTSKADSHLHRINCSYTRHVLELLLAGKLDFLDGLVATNTCDHHMRLASQLENKSDFSFFHYFNMHHSLTAGAREWFLMEVKGMIRKLEESFDTKISEESLRRTISVYNRTRSLMTRLNDLRQNDPSPLDGAEYMQIVLSGMSLPREKFNERLESFVTDIENRTPAKNGRPRLMIMGGACDSPGFVDFIESKGAAVVADSLCFGLRHYLQLIDEEVENPLDAIVDRYFDRIACPSAIDSFDFNYQNLKIIIEKWNIQGIVSAKIKFCDHWTGAGKLLKDALAEDGSQVPLLELEREYNTEGSGQISTRVQAFLEML